MLLAVDIGNSNIVVGVFDGEELKASWRMATDVRRHTDEYAALNMSLLAHHQVAMNHIQSGIISSVVPPLTPTFEQLFQRYFQVTPIVVGAGTKTGMRILYENPRQVGADRVAHAVAAYRLYGGPAIVVDFGTATVFDAIDENGDYLGGAIAPGIALAGEALFSQTSLPRVEIERPKQAIGRNTIASMQAGLFFGYVGLIEGLVGRFQKELGGGAKVVATGGMADRIGSETAVVDIVDHDLVLVGLRLLFDLNQREAA